MLNRWLLGACAAAISASAFAQVFPNIPAPDKLTFPQKRGAVYDEIRGLQGLGRFIVTPNSDYIVYEWQRPYDWSPSNKGVSPAAAKRKQSFIYRVNTTFDRLKSYEKTTSEYLFYPAPGATYYLGSLSPDAKLISFFEIDRDDNKMRAAVVELNDEVSPKITWFTLTPDDARMDLPPVWTSNTELIYPIKTGTTKLARADAKTGQAKPCDDCHPNVLKTKGTVVGSVVGAGKPFDRKGVEDGAKLIAQSDDGRLSVFSIETPDRLALSFKVIETSDELVLTLFDNDKKPKTAAFLAKVKAEAEAREKAEKEAKAKGDAAPKSTPSEGAKGVQETAPKPTTEAPPKSGSK